MCGIAGYVGATPLQPGAIRRCLAAMRRRGPDHAAFRAWTTARGHHVYLLNSRLSIIDLDERANQPLSVGRKWIAYNGEIYNYVELRAEMAAAGQAFKTQSDTEVLLAAFDCFGPDAWDRLEGMWAVAIFDEDDGSLTLSRDRFGEKPLYVFEDDSGLYFGSEPKCIVALMDRHLPVNGAQVSRFLVDGYKALYKTDETFFEGLGELPPATWLRVDDSGQQQRCRYWRPGFSPDECMEYGDAVSGVRSRLVRAVELRLRADVPVAFCLSGGVDSNSLVAIATRLFGYDVHGFTVVDADPRYDERDIVALSVAELGILQTLVKTESTGFLDRLRALVRYHDAPVYTIAYFAHAVLMEQIAASGYRVAVSGTAADEIFSGYYDHHLAYLYEVRNDEALYRAAREAWSEKILPFVRNPYLRDPNLFLRDADFRGHVNFDADRFAGYLVNPQRERFSEERHCADLLRNRMLNELCAETVPVILHEDDLNAMYWSVENRSPYLDRRLVEFCATIPTRHLVRNGLAKAPLRDAVRDLVPVQILDNPRKVGFNAPITSFLATGDPGVRAWMLADSPIYEYVRREPISALLDRTTLPNSDSKFLFNFASSKIFLEEFGG